MGDSCSRSSLTAAAEVARPDAVDVELGAGGCRARARSSAAGVELLDDAAGGFSSRCSEPDRMFIFKDIELGVVIELCAAS